jgi:hypothetical protein
MADSPAVIARKQLYAAYATLDEIDDPALLLEAQLQVGTLAAQIEIGSQLASICGELENVRSAIEIGYSEP